MKKASKILVCTLAVLIVMAVLVACSPMVYTVDFNLGGGTGTITKQEIKKGEKAVRPTVIPTKEGMDFLGWYKDNTANAELFDFDKPIEKNTTIYAKYATSSYAISYILGEGGTGVENANIQHGGTLTRPATDPTRPGHRFTGWYTSADFSTEFDFAAPVTGATTIYAGWESEGAVLLGALSRLLDGNFTATANGTVVKDGVTREYDNVVYKFGGEDENFGVYRSEGTDGNEYLLRGAYLYRTVRGEEPQIDTFDYRMDANGIAARNNRNLRNNARNTRNIGMSNRGMNRAIDNRNLTDNRTTNNNVDNRNLTNTTINNMNNANNQSEPVIRDGRRIDRRNPATGTDRTARIDRRAYPATDNVNNYNNNANINRTNNTNFDNSNVDGRTLTDDTSFNRNFDNRSDRNTNMDRSRISASRNSANRNSANRNSARNTRQNNIGNLGMPFSGTDPQRYAQRLYPYGGTGVGSTEIRGYFTNLKNRNIDEYDISKLFVAETTENGTVYTLNVDFAPVVNSLKLKVNEAGENTTLTVLLAGVINDLNTTFNGIVGGTVSAEDVKTFLSDNPDKTFAEILSEFDENNDLFNLINSIRNMQNPGENAGGFWDTTVEDAFNSLTDNEGGTFEEFIENAHTTRIDEFLDADILELISSISVDEMTANIKITLNSADTITKIEFKADFDLNSAATEPEPDVLRFNQSNIGDRTRTNRADNTDNANIGRTRTLEERNYARNERNGRMSRRSRIDTARNSEGNYPRHNRDNDMLDNVSLAEPVQPDNDIFRNDSIANRNARNNRRNNNNLNNNQINTINNRGNSGDVTFLPEPTMPQTMPIRPMSDDFSFEYRADLTIAISDIGSTEIDYDTTAIHGAEGYNFYVNSLSEYTANINRFGGQSITAADLSVVSIEWADESGNEQEVSEYLSQNITLDGDTVTISAEALEYIRTANVKSATLSAALENPLTLTFNFDLPAGGSAALRAFANDLKTA